MQTEQRPMGSRLQQERLSSPDFVRLQEIAQGLKTDNHRRFLEDILACLRDQDDPIAALELLKALVGEAANQRPEPRLALGQVGQFFEQRLRREPGVTVERLQLRAHVAQAADCGAEGGRAAWARCWSPGSRGRRRGLPLRDSGSQLWQFPGSAEAGARACLDGAENRGFGESHGAGGHATHVASGGCSVAAGHAHSVEG